MNSPTPKWDPIGFDNHSHMDFWASVMQDHGGQAGPAGTGAGAAAWKDRVLEIQRELNWAVLRSPAKSE